MLWTNDLSGSLQQIICNFLNNDVLINQDTKELLDAKLGRSPDIAEAKEHVKNLYNSLEGGGSNNIGSGGFWVTKIDEEVRIEFTISSHGYRDPK